MERYIKAAALIVALLGSAAAHAFTLSCHYGAPPPDAPSGTTNPTVFSRIDYTTTENPTAEGLYLETRANGPAGFLGQILTRIPLPQPQGGFFGHVLTLGSPFQVGTYSVFANASAFVWIFFEGNWYMVQVGLYQECVESGHIP